MVNDILIRCFIVILRILNFPHFVLEINKSVKVWQSMENNYYICFAWLARYGLGGRKYIRRRYLTFIFSMQTWRFELIRRRYGNGNVHIGDDDPIAELLAWSFCISSLTWASCVAYPSDRLRQGLHWGWAEYRLPRLFFVPFRIRETSKQKID